MAMTRFLISLSAVVLLSAASPLGLGQAVAQSPGAGPAGDRLLENERNTINVFRRAASSVVYVINRGIQRDIFSGRTTQFQRGTGSGFLWDDRGHVVTNYHVVRGSSSLAVIADNREYKAKLLGVEPRRDIAVLKIELRRNKRRLTAVKLGRYRDLMVGQKVLAIGSPFGLDRTLTTGVISALGREIIGVGGVTIPDMIQTDASINPGNSGGPLLNSAGELIGMNTMIYSKSGSSAGIGFAVPISLIRRIVPQIIKTGKAVSPGLGIGIWGDDVARYFEIKGVIVRSVKPGSNADRAGLRGTRGAADGKVELGDIIVAIAGKKVESYDDLYNTLDDYEPGDKVTVTFVRNGKTMKVRVRLVPI